MSTRGVRWISRTIVESPLCIGLCLSEEGFKREMKRLDVPRDNWPPFVPDGSQASVHCFEKKAGANICAIICMKDFANKPIDLVRGLLIHEAVHVWQQICETINEDNPSSEFEAYSIQGIAIRLIDAYDEQTKKIRARKRS
jgi:hypothetical protein